MPEKDPLTQVYEGVWELLEASSEFTALVPAQNRIKYVDGPDDDPAFRFPAQASRQATERPQVVVEPRAGATSMFSTSDGTSVYESLQIWVLTGDQRLCYNQGGVWQGLFPVQWSILRALMSWEATLELLTWNGRAGFVTHCAVDAHEFAMGPSRFREQRTPVKADGWNLAWGGNVEMWFPSTGETGLTNT